MNEERKIYPQVIPEIEQWSIYKLSEDRKQFVQEIIEASLQHFLQKPGDQLNDIIAKTIYTERIRIKEEPWKVDPPNERQFWRRIRKQLINSSLDKGEEEAIKNNEEILRTIITRYSEEIVGTFRIQTFLFARRFLTFFFTRLLNTAASRNLHRIWGSKYRLVDRLKVEGNVELIRSLMTQGTVVVVPTHFSNLDSILIGYALDTFAGLPSFSYGAGLNLYNTGYTAYFMNRLGAYRVDRRKKNEIYLETLKTMSMLSIKRGTNSLFFPGGTRSRSGSLEKRLKLGLLSTAVEAQRALYEEDKTRKVFIVPLVLSYHFVLEARFLIEEHLRRSGKEQYIKSKDESSNWWTILKFAWRFFSEGNDITLSFGQPMDVLGNPVNEKGESFDQYGNLIDLKAYFKSEGMVKPDHQRESVYTTLLAEKIVSRYHKDNIVLTSHLVAFAAFEWLKNQNPALDLYGLLRLPPEDYVFPKESLELIIQELQDILFEMKENGNIRLSSELYWKPDRVLRDGISHLGTYHLAKPLLYNKKGQIISNSFNVLYFYHNRLDNYGLDKKVKWRKYLIEEEVEEI